MAPFVCAGAMRGQMPQDAPRRSRCHQSARIFRLFEPDLKPQFAALGVLARKEYELIERGTEIGRANIGAHVVRRFHISDESLDEFGHSPPLRAGNLDRAIERCLDGNPCDCRGNIIGSNGLDVGWRQVDGLAPDGVGDDVEEEFEELRRVHDGERDAGRFDQAFLQRLSTKVGTCLEAAGSDYRKRYVVLHSRGLLGTKEIEDRGFEELEGRHVVEGRRIADIDNHVGADQAFRQPSAGDQVDAGRPGRSRHPVAL